MGLHFVEEERGVAETQGKQMRAGRHEEQKVCMRETGRFWESVCTDTKQSLLVPTEWVSVISVVLFSEALPEVR